MLSRRGFLLSSLVAGCRKSEASRIEKGGPPSWPRTTIHEDVPFIELFPEDGDESSPIVVAVHGRGDRPDHWVETWRHFPARVRIALPRAPKPFGDGYSWFDLRDDMTDEELGAAVSAAEQRLWRGIGHLRDKKQKLIVTGFSQGGILSFAMASRHADDVAYAFPMGGACPGPLLPKNHAHAAPVMAFHGTEDPILQVKWARETVKAFAAEGNHAELKEYAGVGHAVPPAMRRDVWNAITNELARSPGGGR